MIFCRHCNPQYAEAFVIVLLLLYLVEDGSSKHLWSSIVHIVCVRLYICKPLRCGLSSSLFLPLQFKATVLTGFRYPSSLYLSVCVIF